VIDWIRVGVYAVRVILALAVVVAIVLTISHVRQPPSTTG